MSYGALNDLDFLSARLHGRRSQMAEGERLDGLCRLRNIAELGRILNSEIEVLPISKFQQQLVQEVADELLELTSLLNGAGAELMLWLMVRFQIENIKVLLRNLQVRAKMSEGSLIRLPKSLALDTSRLLAADSLEQFVTRLPSGAVRKTLSKALATYPDEQRPFFLEGILDCGYFHRLLLLAARLPREDYELLQPIFLQEVDAFHLSVVARGKFIYGIPSEQLLPLHVRGSGIGADSFRAMLGAPDVLAAAELAVGHAIDTVPQDAPESVAPVSLVPMLEALAWKRFLRLSNRAFRCSQAGLAQVVGYIGIRRIEAANVITVSEGILAGMGAEKLRARLHPRNDLIHV